jgi:hypothetical protein
MPDETGVRRSGGSTPEAPFGVEVGVVSRHGLQGGGGDDPAQSAAGFARLSLRLARRARLDKRRGQHLAIEPPTIAYALGSSERRCSR